MENQNEQLTRNIHDYFSKNNFDKCIELTAPDVQIVANAFGMTFKGQSEFMNFMQGFKQAFPDMVLKHTNILSNGNKVAVEFIAYGTHTGTLRTPAGDIPASGKKVELKVAEFLEWENGKLKHLVNYQDAGSLMRQIGAM